VKSEPFFSERAAGNAMAPLRVRRRSLQRRYRDETRALKLLAERLPGRPTPDDIHDLRVTARRVQVMRRLLPKDVRRSQASVGYDLALKSALKSTSQLRDIDTLMDTLKMHRANLPPELLVNLENQRSDFAARAKAASSVISDSPAPDLDPSTVKGKKLSRRLRKQAKRHGREASQLVGEVLSDESKVEELHALRKEAKKLRYLHELAEKSPNVLPTLTHWQDSLGAIHDLDVAMAYLERSDFGPKQVAIRELRKVRHQRYLEFVRDYRANFKRAPGVGVLPFIGPSGPSVPV